MLRPRATAQQKIENRSIEDGGDRIDCRDKEVLYDSSEAERCRRKKIRDGSNACGEQQMVDVYRDAQAD